jgi:hypothetical protein
MWESWEFESLRVEGRGQREEVRDQTAGSRLAVIAGRREEAFETA